MDKQGNNKYKRQKLYTYASVADIIRLRKICADYGFNSIYQLLQYLIYCFLRVADPNNDTIIDPLPLEIEEMFTKNEEWEKRKRSNRSHEGMSMKRKADQRKYKTPDDLTP